MLIDDDIDAIISRGEEKTKSLNAKYAGLSIDALTNFKSEVHATEWEGNSYGGAGKVRSRLGATTFTLYQTLNALIVLAPTRRMDRVRKANSEKYGFILY